MPVLLLRKASKTTAANAALDNIFARKSVRTYLDKGVEKEKIDWMLRAGMAAPTGRDLRPWEFVVISDRGYTRFDGNRLALCQDA